MAPKSNQDIERHYFELFRKLYSLPNGQVIYGDKPDVIIDGERKIGIEVTNFFLERGENKESEQNQRRIRRDILRKAHLKYKERGGKYEISFSFNKEQPIKNSKKLISRIVELIQKLEVSRTRGISKCFLGDVPELDFVYINPNSYNDPHWRLTQGYTGQMMSIHRLTEIVRDKENKANNYRKCDSYWLLIVIDSFDRAQEQTIPIEEVKLESDFYEKIILYITGPEHVLEFKGS